jgi:hypothetical protein
MGKFNNNNNNKVLLKILDLEITYIAMSKYIFIAFVIGVFIGIAVYLKN